MGVMTYLPYGAGGIIVRVETDIRRGIPGIDITGLAEGAVREARERVRAAFRNSGFKFPQDRVLINLAPAGLKKDGAALDLPIALSVMAAANLAPIQGNILVMGELELSGKARPVRGVLAAIAAGLAANITEFIVPAQNAGEAAIMIDKGARFAAAENLQEAVNALFFRNEKGALPINLPQNSESSAARMENIGDFAEVRGQPLYKRAMEIAAAGGHNALIFGPPGAGKTMLARRLPSIMAELTPDEAVEVTRLHSLAGPSISKDGQTGFIDKLITRPPFRSPHHSASAEGILGGGRNPRPGEITLAHFGVLYLDETPQFRINVLQALREPLEDRVISISRAEGQIRLPAEFQLLLTANACRCGKLGMRNSDKAGLTDTACFCSPDEITRYWRRIGGALLDRIEIRAAVLPPKTEEMKLSNNSSEEKSAEIAKRVKTAVEIQRHRYKGTNIRRNALLSARLASKYCPMNEKAENAFYKAVSKLGLSGRAYHGVLRVARTIADLEEKDIIETEHILEAVYHRRQGEDPWEILTIE